MCFPELGAQYVCASKVSRNGLAKEEALVVPAMAVLCDAAVTSSFVDTLHLKSCLRGDLLPDSIAPSTPLLPGSECGLLGLLLAW